MPKCRTHARSKSLTSSGFRLNIRKFTGATSRDALRLVREALGADAVVLSNRTLDDGSVEIVALADSDLAAVAPPAARPRVAPSRVPESVPAAAVPGIVSRPGIAPRPAVNPYAAGEGGLPDVFSSVFGASADPQEADAHRSSIEADAPAAAAPSIAAPAPDRRPPLPNPHRGWSSTRSASRSSATR